MVSQQVNNAETAGSVTEFVSSLIAAAVEVAGIGPDNCAYDQASTILVVKQGEGEQERTSKMHVGQLYDQYKAQANPEARTRFLSNIVETYILGKCQLPQEMEDALPLLLPQLISHTKLQDKLASMPPGCDLPHCGLNGESGTVVLGLAVIVVADFGSSVVPVLSANLINWGGISFEKVLERALENLRECDFRQKGANGCTGEWEAHPSGCKASTWNDQFDSTRAALLPGTMPPTGNSDNNAAPEGDRVCVFGASHKCLTAGAANPIGLCFMGDLLMDIKKTGDLLAPQAFRLAAVPNFKSQGQASRAAAHPLFKPAPAGGEGGGPGHWMWSLYEPGKGEFSVPDTQAEVDAVLAGVQSGQIPVFRREGGGAAAGGGDEAAKAAAALAKLFEDAKALGNKAFAKGCYAKAAKLYSKCLEVDPASANAHTVLGNRAAAHLKLHNPLNEEGFAERSLADADAAVAREAGWGKGHFRRAQALAVLGRRRDAHAALQEARRLLPRDAGVGTALRNSDALLTMVAPGSAKAEAVHALLAAAYGWSATKADGKGGSPGWMPTQLDTSDTSRAALMRLYALVRDEASTARDRAAGSEYATAIPGLKPEAKTRKAALSHMVRAAGERGLIVLRASMLGSGDAKLAGLLELGQATAAPLESRSVPQLLACLLEVPELKKASEIFEKILAADPDAKTLLSSSVTSDEAAVDAAADAAAAQKAAREAEAAQKAAAEEAARARVEQERAAAERASQAKAAADEKAAREKAEKAKRVARAMTDGRRVEQENVEEEKKAALRAVEGNKIKISVDKDFVMPAAVPVTGGAGSLGGMGAALGLGGAGAAPAHWDPLAGASSVIGNGIGKRAGIDNVSVTHAAHKNPLLGSSRGASGGYNAGSSADFGAADGSDYSTFF